MNQQAKKILIASDHAGFELKQYLIYNLTSLNKISIQWEDLGANNYQSVDYPDFANKLIAKIDKTNDLPQGILICGSGQGMAIRANKFSFIRAALCHTGKEAQLARQHNNAQILCIGSRLVEKDIAQNIVTAFFTQKFEKGRHVKRVDKIHIPT